MKKILISLISLLALSIALPSISSAYTFNQQDQAILEAVYTRLQVLQQEDSQRIQDIHQSIQKVLPQYSGRSFAILEAIINHVELKNPTLRNYDGEITSEQIRQFKTAPAVGENNAQYLIIEYSDIQCPFCERFMSNNTIIDFMNSHPGAIKKTFRHYPLAFHQRAMPAAIAAECIHQEFGLASMYRYMRVLMETSDLSDNSLQTVAEQAGVWNNSVSACISEKTTETIIQDHIQEGKMFTVSGTPSSVILDLHSGKRIKITGAVPLASIEGAFNTFTNGQHKSTLPVQQVVPQPVPTPTPQPPSNTLSNQQLTTLLADIPLIGSLKDILIIEYSDMQCPFCQRQVAQKTLETVVANNPGKISTTFQHFPLSFHTNAQPAAEAAECFKQETTTELFYDYIHDLFISKDLSTANLIAQATKRGVDQTTMEE